MGLRERLAAVIAREGPIPVSRYMRLCLHDPEAGYYATRPRLGESGDFLTAPGVSQIFGEILGLWAVEAWMTMGSPGTFRLVELGPGEGRMMTDVLRAARVVPGFLGAADIWLVETSAPLRSRQARALEGGPKVRWADRLEAVAADAPIIVLANEFLDCLPIDQWVKTPDGWRERRIGVDGAGALTFVATGNPPPARRCWPDAPIGAVAESSAELSAFAGSLAARLRQDGGHALFIDYGRDAPGWGDTLQALRRHRKQGPLDHPGEADLTAHVDFPAFAAAARSAGAMVAPLRTQGAFLRARGAEARARVLARGHPDRAEAIDRQVRRLIGEDGMGELFKVATLWAPGPGGEA